MENVATVSGKRKLWGIPDIKPPKIPDNPVVPDIPDLPIDNPIDIIPDAETIIDNIPSFEYNTFSHPVDWRYVTDSAKMMPSMCQNVVTEVYCTFKKEDLPVVDKNGRGLVNDIRD